MKQYRVHNGPVSLPASLYGSGRTLQTGEAFASEPNSWIRRALAGGRVAEVEPAEVEPAEVEPVEVEPAEVEPVAVEPAAVEPAEVEPTEVAEAKPTAPTRRRRGSNSND